MLNPDDACADDKMGDGQSDTTKAKACQVQTSRLKLSWNRIAFAEDDDAAYVTNSLFHAVFAFSLKYPPLCCLLEWASQYVEGVLSSMPGRVPSSRSEQGSWHACIYPALDK